ncbi:unnamed protein product [Brassicogethes aeneus]|uniref:EGF domain-specific O-linked N-acetylglucosamine transferase n=1 Tax=Brassicogethes aeneus TaxID=1431903 RepID=A0A9P0FHB7_BRAAE|nr:unnamed protein product [Brassicogethes aeneus]
MLTVFILFNFIVQVLCDNYSSINLPEEHLQYYFKNFPQIARDCEKDENCPYKEHLNKNKCWGYEYGCPLENKYSTPSCPGDHKGWVNSKLDQVNTFYTQADFGYIRQQLRELKIICEPMFVDDSSLECSDHLRFCRGRNLMLNFTLLLYREEPIRYKMDVLKDGEIGGYCELKKERLDKNLDHLSPLQSWSPEIRYFSRLNRRPIVEGDCDVVIEKPTFIMKIDATVNMYHHFCDFLNLYASMHLNATHRDAFSTDVQILLWETYTYKSAFQDTWQAFTDHPVLDLKAFRGDSVCFKNVVFPLLPRMIFGLYYNTPLIYGCEGSGLFDAFSKHVLHRLKIPFHKRTDSKIKITFISRDTRYRKVINEDELLEELEKNEEYDVEKVVYNKNVPFKTQLEVTRNSDILIGIHGAGLTHLLFLPEWASIFEIYNCEDASCYMDLARLKGAKYFTWEDSAKLISEQDGSHNGGAHAKFANYRFDKNEFVRIVDKAVGHVKNHTKFKELLDTLNTSTKKLKFIENNVIHENNVFKSEENFEKKHMEDVLLSTGEGEIVNIPNMDHDEL